MTKTEVQRFRNLFRHRGVILEMDNARIEDASLETTTLLWDDDNEIVLVICTAAEGMNHYDRKRAPFRVKVYSYEMIQAIYSYADMAQLKTVVEEFDGTFEKLCDYDSTNIKNNPSKTSLEGAMKVYQSLYDEIYKKQSYIRKGFYDKVNPVYDGNVHPSTPISLTPSNP